MSKFTLMNFCRPDLPELIHFDDFDEAEKKAIEIMDSVLSRWSRMEWNNQDYFEYGEYPEPPGWGNVYVRLCKYFVEKLPGR